MSPDQLAGEPCSDSPSAASIVAMRHCHHHQEQPVHHAGRTATALTLFAQLEFISVHLRGRFGPARFQIMARREYFLKQAETCLRLARGTTDRDTAEDLMAMAAEYQANAREAENQPPKDKEK
jgi:hypothetical protein